MANASSYTKPNNVIFLPGDRTAWYKKGASIVLHVTKYDTKGNHIAVGQTNSTITKSEYQPTGLTLQSGTKSFTGQPVTRITLSTAILTLAQTAAGTKTQKQNYSINITHKDGIDIYQTGWYPTSNRNEIVNYTDATKNIIQSTSVINNWFILKQNEVDKFPPGFQFKVTGGNIDGIYTTIWAKNFLNTNNTIVRVVEPIEFQSSSYVANSANINEYFIGYDQYKNRYTSNNQYGATNSTISEKLIFNWENKQKQSVFNGQQFKIIRTFVEGTGLNTKYKIEVNGDATKQLSQNDKINLIESSIAANNKTYDITEVPRKIITTKQSLGSDYTLVDNKYDFIITQITVQQQITPQSKSSSQSKYFAGWIELQTKAKIEIPDPILPSTV